MIPDTNSKTKIMSKKITINVTEKLHKELSEAAKAAGKLRPSYFLEMLITGHVYTQTVKKDNNEPSK